MEPELPLRDIHLPAPIGWWPPAPGWWALLIGMPVLLVVALWLWRWLRRNTAKKTALRELEAIVRSDRDRLEKVRALAILMRRVSLTVRPREEVAGLVGEEWLEFLGGSFSKGVGRLLIEAPYRRQEPAELDELFTLCRDWINRLPGSAGRQKARPAPFAKHGKSKQS